VPFFRRVFRSIAVFDAFVMISEMANKTITRSRTGARDDELPESLVERVLGKLGFNSKPELNLHGLSALYAAWCQRVPFDNVRKLIHVRGGNSGPLPGSTAIDYFEAWLKFGTGGTCWSGAGASHALLVSLGFDAVRGKATMLVTPDLPPNHGTVAVTIDGVRYLFDSSILSGTPLLLHEGEPSIIGHRAWGVRCIWRNGYPFVVWRPLNRLDGFECRLDSWGATRREFETMYEKTRAWSPFNYELTARLNRGPSVIGIALGHSVELHEDGSVRRVSICAEERTRLLIEALGMAEEIVTQLPADIPTPPPPGSKTAAQASSTASRGTG
jgi:N-hydroxyarylamine O-acetyltransferase